MSSRVTATLECSICCNTAEADVAGEWIVLIACGHIFHSGCIREWCNTPIDPGIGPGRRKKHNDCPYCKENILHPDGDKKQLSRFRKLIFAGELRVREEGPGGHNGSSSSPSRRVEAGGSSSHAGASRPSAKARLRISDDEEEDAANQVSGNNNGETESESDGESSRPARPVRSDGTIVAEMRGLLASKTAQIGELEKALADRSDQIDELNAEMGNLHGTVHAFDERVQQLTGQKKVLDVKVAKLKEEKKGLEKHLRDARDSVENYKQQGQRLAIEIGTVKEKLAVSDTKYVEVERHRQESATDADERYAALEERYNRLIKQHSKLVDANKLYEAKLARRQVDIERLNAEADVLRRRDVKGKGKALDQDAPIETCTGSDDAKLKNASATGAPPSGQTARKRIHSLLSEDEASLEVDEKDVICDDTLLFDDFADLDAHSHHVLNRPQQSMRGGATTTTTTSASYSTSKTISRFFSDGNDSGKRPLSELRPNVNGKALGAVLGRKSSGSDKWADMALGGSKGLSAGAKKKIRVGV